MKQLAKFGFVLGTTCLAATLVLAFTYQMTKPRIEEQARLEEEAALKSILPQAETFTKKEIAGLTYYDAARSGRTIGYCVKVIANGYGGYIYMMVGIDTSGRIEGLRVLQQQETPGLGAKITEIKPGEKEPYFLAQFRAQEASGLELKKNIDAITGATISSKAVVDGVRETVEKFLAEIKK